MVFINLMWIFEFLPFAISESIQFTELRADRFLEYRHIVFESIVLCREGELWTAVTPHPCYDIVLFALGKLSCNANHLNNYPKFATK